MNNELNEIFFEKVEEANKKGINSFTFPYKGEYFYSYWHKFQWTNLIMVVLL